MVHRRDVDKRVKGSMRAGAELANSSKPPHLSTICQAMTTGSTITVIVASFLMAMAVELMMPLLLTVHLFSALVSWLGHILLPSYAGKEDSSSWSDRVIKSQINCGEPEKSTLRG